MFVRTIALPLMCLVLLALNLTVQGQDNNEPTGNPLTEITDDDNILLEINGDNDALRSELSSEDINRVTLRQMGQQNEADIKQFSSRKGSPNLVIVDQHGTKNLTDIDQSGANNAIALTQNGNGNYYRADMEGELLINSIIQEGNKNIVEQFLRGTDMNYAIIQQGNGHEITQIENGTGTGYKVIQKGESMKIQIEQSHVFLK
jgi:hypothetical protein